MYSYQSKWVMQSSYVAAYDYSISGFCCVIGFHNFISDTNDFLSERLQILNKETYLYSYSKIYFIKSKFNFGSVKWYMLDMWLHYFGGNQVVYKSHPSSSALPTCQYLLMSYDWLIKQK